MALCGLALALGAVSPVSAQEDDPVVLTVNGQEIRYVQWSNTLELALRKEVLLDPELKGNNISVTAINGIVLFTGEVASDAQRRRVTEIAKQNVKTLSVVNELQLAGTTSIT